MSDFIQLHFLTSYSPSNLNRDDFGRPKTAQMGGFDRLRISSQGAKRAWRVSDCFVDKFRENIGLRTKKYGIELYHYMVDKEAETDLAIKVVKKVMEQYGKLKTKDKDKPLSELELEQIVHISPEEKIAIKKLCDKLITEKREPLNEELNFLSKTSRAVDLALFGRMLASNPGYNVEPAVQVSHAITVNSTIIEDDYFTAVDDLNAFSTDTGSAHIGVSNFGSGIFYLHIVINKTLLNINLKNKQQAESAIKALTFAAATVSPSGKQSSYASRARALYILAEKGKQMPRQLTSAFLNPVDGPDMLNKAITRLEKLCDNMDLVYGKCADIRYKINVEKAEGTMDELLKFVGA
jgi:CRISPR system Cascade subunit CasC